MDDRKISNKQKATILEDSYSFLKRLQELYDYEIPSGMESLLIDEVAQLLDNPAVAEGIIENAPKYNSNSSLNKITDSINKKQEAFASVLYKIMCIMNIADTVKLDDCRQVAYQYSSLKDFAKYGLEGFLSSFPFAENQKLLMRLIFGFAFERNVYSDYNSVRFYNLSDIARVLTDIFKDADGESVHVFYVDSKMRILRHLICTGSFSSTYISPRTIFIHRPYVEKCGFFIAHNHMNGNILPSNKDLAMCNKIKTMSKTFNLKLIDSFIVSGSRVYSVELKRAYAVPDHKDTH